MANDFRVNLYRRSTINGVYAIRPVLNGPAGQRKMRGITENVTVIYALGDNVDGNSAFEVNMKGAKSFITDWNGVDSEIGGDVTIIRVNKYTRTLQPEGSDFAGEYKWQYFGYSNQSSARVYVPNIANCVSVQQNGVDAGGNDQGQECFRITMVDGLSFVTDHDGWNAIQGSL